MIALCDTNLTGNGIFKLRKEHRFYPRVGTVEVELRDTNLTEIVNPACALSYQDVCTSTRVCTDVERSNDVRVRCPSCS